MTRIIKVSVIIGGAILLALIANLIYKKSKYGYSTDWEIHKKYRWVFKDSIIKDIDTIGYSYVTKKDILNNFHYKSNLKKHDFGYNIIVWEFKKMNDIKLENISINKKENLFFVHFDEGVTLDKGTDLETDVKFGYSFNNGFDISVDKTDTIISFYNGRNFKGCYGKIRQVSLGNKKEGDQIVLHNELNSSLTSIIAFKRKSSLYLVVIQSEKYFDSDIINILNL